MTNTYGFVDLDRISSFTRNELMIFDFNQEAAKAVEEWALAVKIKYVKPIVITGSCGNGKTHLALWYLNSLMQLTKPKKIYWWDVMRIEGIRQNIKILDKESVLLFEAVSHRYIPETEFIINYCSDKNIPLLITDEEGLHRYANCDYVKIQSPSLKFYKLFWQKKLNLYPHIHSKFPRNIKSIRHLEGLFKKELMKFDLKI